MGQPAQSILFPGFSLYSSLSGSQSYLFAVHFPVGQRSFPLLKQRLSQSIC